MEPSTQGTEPQFTGETMKVPVGARTATTVGTPINRGPLFGIIIGLLFLALVLILVGMMLWNYLLVPPTVTIESPTRPTADMNQEPESTTARAQADAAGVLSTSNELTAIEADLLSTDLTSLDAEITAIDSIIESAETAAASVTP